MRSFLLCIFVSSLFFGCSKKCQTCKGYWIHPSTSGGDPRTEMIYEDKRMCGDELRREKKKDGNTISRFNNEVSTYYVECD